MLNRPNAKKSKSKRTALSSAQVFSAGSTQSQSLLIHEILPDPHQVREMLPSDTLKDSLYAGTSPLEIMDSLLSDFADSPVVKELVEFAGTIQNAGLINPISVRPVGATDLTDLPSHITHIITTGERRWWAHVYLAATGQMILGDQSPTEIAVTYTASSANAILHQLLENFQREDLNAAEKAFGLIQLKDELGKTSKTTWDEVYAALGIKKRYGIYLRNVNKLSPKAIEKIKVIGLKERAIRPITLKLIDHPDLQLKALAYLEKMQNDPNDHLKTLDQFIDELLAPEDKAEKPVRKPRTAKLVNPKTFSKTVTKTAKQISSIDLLSIRKENRDEVVSALQELIEAAQEKLSTLD